MGKRIEPLEIAKAYLLLGVDQKYDSDNLPASVRDEIVYHLSKNISALKRLSEERRVTLNNLAEAGLLSGSLSAKIRRISSGDAFGPGDPSIGARLSHHSLGELIPEEIKSLRLFHLSGKQTVLQVEILRELYQATDGFRTVTARSEEFQDIGHDEQEGLLAVIREELRTDPAMRLRLSQMFRQTNRKGPPRPI